MGAARLVSGRGAYLRNSKPRFHLWVHGPDFVVGDVGIPLAPTAFDVMRTLAPWHKHADARVHREAERLQDWATSVRPILHPEVYLVYFFRQNDSELPLGWDPDCEEDGGGNGGGSDADVRDLSQPSRIVCTKRPCNMCITWLHGQSSERYVTSETEDDIRIARNWGLPARAVSSAGRRRGSPAQWTTYSGPAQGTTTKLREFVRDGL